jgi:hypothetical protein
MIRGFEVKISRSDYRREARDPMKAEEIAAYCDSWWIVTPAGLIREPELELPPAWGLMELNGAGLSVRRPATQTEARPLTRAFVAALLRGASKQLAGFREGWIRVGEIEERLDRAREEGVRSVPTALAEVQNGLKKARAAIEAFRAESGVDLLQGWGGAEHAARLGRATRIGNALLGEGYNGVEEIAARLRGQINCIGLIAKALEAEVPKTEDPIQTRLPL